MNIILVLISILNLNEYLSSKRKMHLLNIVTVWLLIILNIFGYNENVSNIITTLLESYIFIKIIIYISSIKFKRKNS